MNRPQAGFLLLEAGIDIEQVPDLPGHCRLITTQIYDRRRLTTLQNASHDAPMNAFFDVISSWSVDAERPFD